MNIAERKGGVWIFDCNIRLLVSEKNYLGKWRPVPRLANNMSKDLKALKCMTYFVHSWYGLIEGDKTRMIDCFPILKTNESWGFILFSVRSSQRF